MTSEQFDFWLQMLGGDLQSPSIQAARSVLIDGNSQAAAARAVGVQRATVNQTVKRFTEADSRVRRVYNLKAFENGQVVRLVPTQGDNLEELQGRVTAVSKTLVSVQVVGQPTVVRYRTSDGLPVRRLDRKFPCYKVVVLD